MPITTDYDTFAARYHGSAVEISHSEDTPDEFFDALDEFFGTDDGYKNHLYRIYGMKDKIASLQASEAKCESQIEHLHQTRMESVNDAHKDLIDRVEELMKENEKLLKFITGGGEAEDVEEIIRGEMSKEFIDSNQEHWDQMELFQED